MRISDWSSDVCSSDLSNLGKSGEHGALWRDIAGCDRKQFGGATKGTGQVPCRTAGCPCPTGTRQARTCDLHLANIAVIDDEPVLFDCLEFDPTLATTDVLYDLAFLLMDLLARGFQAQANLQIGK